MSLTINCKRLCICTAAIILNLTACDNGIVGTGEDVKGIAQKGPFVVGSEVVIHERSAPDYSESHVYFEKITNTLGLFDFAFKPLTLYDIEVTGQFFDENNGTISSEPLTLISSYFHTPETNKSVSVNLLTHIIHKRVNFFIANGDAPDLAIEKANNELKLQLETALLPEHLDNLDLNHISLYNFDSSNDEKGNAVLLFISASFMKASKMYPNYPSLQVIVNRLANEMETSGVIDNSNLSILDIAAKSLNADRIEDFLLTYSKQVSDYDISIPDIRWLLDTDGDSIHNDVDLDDDGDNISDDIDPHPYDFEILPTTQNFTVVKNTLTTLNVNYPIFAFVCSPKLSSSPLHGTLTDFNYQPNSDYIGPDQFEFTINCILPSTELYSSPPFIVNVDVVDTIASATPLP